MEMHQIRYFLAVARELNFTRAAEHCNVSQPALTRAIQQLEDEFGGQLLRREGRLSHLTDLGERMLPLMMTVSGKCARRQVPRLLVQSRLLAGAPPRAGKHDRNGGAGAVPSRDAAQVPQPGV